MAVIRGFLIWLLLAGVAMAQADAVIEGPSESQAGNLVVLSSQGSVADATKWIVPPSLAGRSIQFGDQIAFAVRESGEFVFHLVAVHSSEVVDIDVATHAVVITDGFGDPPPTDPGQPGDPGEPPDQQPPGDFAELRKLSQQGAVRANDPVTASKLAAALAEIDVQPLPQMQAAVRAAVEAVLLSREGESRQRDWLGEWRRPVNEWLAAQSASIDTAEKYAAALTAIADGLDAAAGEDQVPQPEPTEHRVVMYSRDNCSWCQRWKREVQPRLEAAGWQVSEEFSRGSVPEFLVVVGEKRERLVGYQGEESFAQFLRHLSRAYNRLSR